jgi:hypothetical protein
VEKERGCRIAEMVCQQEAGRGERRGQLPIVEDAPRDASAEDVLEAMQAVHAGEAVCPGTLCASLFRFFEREAT